jgi:hypothetical protein
MMENERNAKDISLEKARELLGDASIPDAELVQIIADLKLFCGIICAVHSLQKEKEQKGKRETDFPDKDIKEVA